MKPSPKRSTILRASYDYCVREPRVVVLYDTLAPRSLTNDMEHVLREVAQLEGLPTLAGYQVIYRDSEGQWAGVQLDAGGRMQHFFGLGSFLPTEVNALAALAQRANSTTGQP